MKVKCELNIDTETGEWEIRFWNKTKPGEPVDYTEVKPLLDQIFKSYDKQVMEGILSDDNVFKEIH